MGLDVEAPGARESDPILGERHEGGGSAAPSGSALQRRWVLAVAVLALFALLLVQLPSAPPSVRLPGYLPARLPVAEKRCRTAGGFVWCESKHKCVRLSEEKCDGPPSPLQLFGVLVRLLKCPEGWTCSHAMSVASNDVSYELRVMPQTVITGPAWENLPVERLTPGDSLIVAYIPDNPDVRAPHDGLAVTSVHVLPPPGG
eukprot:Hpha_TRINITY_DN20313_c0_g1::TRINITY_DN20313_c0_g1_i1::g.138063::m.138063